jgi:lipopolysaccharide biosynthesis regulator YciM
MTESNEGAFAKSGNPDRGSDIPQKGLTKREYFAASALQGLLTIYTDNLTPFKENIECIARLAVNAADALIDELSKK